jgi:hypothetical protein
MPVPRMMAIRYFVVLMLSVLVCCRGAFTPLYNWDLIPYSALVLEKEGFSGEALHRTTYNALQKELPVQVYEQLTTGAYPAAIAHDTGSFRDMLVFYRQRVAYVGLISLLVQLGFPVVLSSVLVSSFLAGLLVLLIGWYMIRERLPIWFLPLLVSLTGLTEIARLSTPDAMATSLVLLLVLTAERRLVWAGVLSFLLPLVRLDFWLFPILLSFFLWLGGLRSGAMVVAVCSTLSFLLVQWRIPGYGLAITFQHTFNGPFTAPGTLANTLTWDVWKQRFLHALGDAVNHAHAVIYALGFYQFIRQSPEERKTLHGRLFVWLPLLFVAVHFLLFPTYLTRFFVGMTVLILLRLMRVMNRAESIQPKSPENNLV